MTTACPHVLDPIAASDRAELLVRDPTVFGHWDEFLATHPDATFFHSKPWAMTLVDAYDFRCHYIVATSNGRMAGLFPVMESQSWLRGKRGISLPFTDECSPLLSDEVDADSFLRAGEMLARFHGWKYLDLCGERGCFAADSEPAYYTHRLPLNSDAQSVLNNCESSVRRAIRKAERSGVTIHFATNLDAIRVYYRLHCRTRTKHGVPPQPFRFFRAICNRVLEKGHGFVTLAMFQDRPIAGAVFFRFKNKAIYKFSASDDRFQHVRGTNLLLWRTIEKLLDSGATELSFGRTSLFNTGLQRFKLGWGAEESTIRAARYCFKERRFVTRRDLAAGLHTRLCAALPVFVSRWIGHLAYAHMS